LARSSQPFAFDVTDEASREGEQKARNKVSPGAKPEIKLTSTMEALHRAAAAEFVSAASDAVRQRGAFNVCLSGGSTPKSLYSLLATDSELRNQIPWGKCFFFWGDERHVPSDNAESNYRMAKEAMLDKVPVPPANIFRVSSELQDAAEAARKYQRTLSEHFKLKGGELPRFDLTLLGMGPDGHTASLFPGTSALNETTKLVVDNWVGKFNTQRITMTVPVLNNSARVIFLVAGDDKALPLKAVLEGPFVPIQLPIQSIRPTTGSALWLIDPKAGALLTARSAKEA
jgi:6-phosphogluconolactonase